MISYGTKKVAITLILAAAIISLAATAFSEDAWIPDFEDICSKTEESSAMSKDELKTIIERCDKLRPLIEKSDNPQKNVYLFRLDKCKKLFLFVLEVSDN